MNRVNLYFLLTVLAVILVCSGCGETVRGMSKDAHRIGQGVKTVFVSNE